MSFLSACGAAGPGVFDAVAVPDPPAYSAQFKRGLAGEIAAAPRNALILETLKDASQYYDRIRRLKAPGPAASGGR